MRRMLRRTVEIYGGDDKWLRGHLITLREAVSKRHPILKRFYGMHAAKLDRAQMLENDGGITPTEEAIKDALDTVGCMTARQIGEEVGIDPRNVRKAIEGMIAQGHAIVATKEGYKLARSMSELLRYQRSLLAQANATMRRAIQIGKIAHDFERGWR